MTKRILIRCALALSLGLLSACSSFDRQWKSASQGKGGATCWDGTWTSGTKHEAHGRPHGGRLRAVLAPLPGGKLAASFHANWRIFSGDFDTTLEPVGRAAHNKVRLFHGSHELPAIFGGLYTYDARLSGDHFTSTYSCSLDHGVFSLERVKPTMEHFQLNPEH